MKMPGNMQAMMQQQGLNTRVLKGNLDKAKKLYQSILAEVAKAEAAAKDKKAAELLTAQQAAAKLNQDLIKMVDPYEKAPNDGWLKTQIADSKDKSTIYYKRYEPESHAVSASS